MRRLLLLLLLHGFAALPQKVLHGKVIDAKSGEPLVGANVFVANSTWQTLSNEAGQFSIQMPDHAAQLVVTFVGYEPQVLQASDLPDRLVRYVVPMHAEVNQLKPVAILSAAHRKHLMNAFIAYFIGTTQNASQTKIMNPDEIVFHLEDDGSWEASATEPLIIENRGLNYRIDFVLSAFKMLPRENKCIYAGYPAFSDLKPPSRKVLAARQRAYLGSQMHFVRSAYNGTLRAEGFTIDHYMRERNPNFPTQEKYLAYRNEIQQLAKSGTFKKVEPEYNFTLLSKNIDPAQLVTTEGDQKFLSFPFFLQVLYTGSFEEDGFAHHREHGHQQSMIQLEAEKARIFPDGNIQNIDAVIFTGYMAWKKMADLVPTDYQPETYKK